MALTVGDVLDFLDGWDRSDRVVIDITGPDVWLFVPSDHLTIGSGQGGAAGDDIVVEILLDEPSDRAR